MVGPNTWILFNGPGQVNGSAVSWLSVGPNGRFDANNNGVSSCPVILSFGNPGIHFSTAFAEAYDGGTAYLYAMNFVNKNFVSGPKAHIVGGGKLIVYGLGTPDPNYLPGNSPIIQDQWSVYR